MLEEYIENVRRLRLLAVITIIALAFLVGLASTGCVNWALDKAADQKTVWQSLPNRHVCPKFDEPDYTEHFYMTPDLHISIHQIMVRRDLKAARK